MPLARLSWAGVSPRRIRRDRSGPPDPVPGPERVESWPDGDWIVRRVPGAASGKANVPGTPHVVAWPADGPRMPGRLALDERRHWHRACWERRLRRTPGVRRRGAP